MLVDADLLDAVIGLGPNLFYNSPMEACIVVCRSSKPAKRRGQVIFIDAVNEVTRERSTSYLSKEHQDRIATTYHDFKDVDGFAKVDSLEKIRGNDGNLSIPLYVNGRIVSEGKAAYRTDGVKIAVMEWQKSSVELSLVIERFLEVSAKS